MSVSGLLDYVGWEEDLRFKKSFQSYHMY